MRVGKLIERLREALKHPSTPSDVVSWYTIKAWNPDSGRYEPISGYVIDPLNRTIELTTNEDGYEINLGMGGRVQSSCTSSSKP